MKVIGKTVCLMGRVDLYILPAKFMKGNGKMIKNVALENIDTMMEKYTKAIGIMIKGMDLAKKLREMVIFSKDSM